MDWLKKLAGYAPDIVSAVVSGGSTLPVTALRILSKEMLGYETDNKKVIEKAIDSATPDEMLKLKQANNEFILRKMQIETQDTQHARVQNNGHWMTWLLPLLVFALFSTMCLSLMFLDMSAENTDVVTFLIGQTSGFMAACLTFWVGSSRGSYEKSSKL